MKDKIRIGSWQGPIADNDFDKNLLKVKSVLEESKEMGLDFLCFPETYLSGFSKEAAMDSSKSIDDLSITELIALSKKYDTVILVGLNEKRDDKIFNSQLVFFDGKLLGISHKTILTGGEKPYCSTDLDLPVYEAKGIKFGVVICHSTSFVEPALYLRWKGARLLFTPHLNNIPPEGYDNGKGGRITFWDHRSMVLRNQGALATLLKMVVVRSNIVMIDVNGLGCGDSNIWDMDGAIVAEGKPFTECIVTAEFDKQIFLEDHEIDRREVPIELCEMISQAAKEFNN